MKQTNYKVIVATKEDIPTFQRFVKEMTEGADVLFPPINLMKATKYGLRMIEDGTVLCLVKDKEIIGAVCGSIGYWWFADQEFLTEMGFWIDKEHRTIETASLLLKAFKNIADKRGMACMLNTLDGKEIPARDKLFAEHDFRRVGLKYGYGF
jgi:hypothetical protein